ncbi:double-strand break repair protein AddB [Meridianimarinicoccus roseus]|uniref:Double-strand break repair protein AddB n=1 Tax=Meridianimarinicoccus roseus TaxID=2072018 RepID=A0A2V2LHB8_9RHOB|nr:double-strand break repair protein AddB [Meridianimarinicoccus roseus]PWR02904.1 double-strand break repair protein AddB [Meridianimarinicoccus roseus]
MTAAAPVDLRGLYAVPPGVDFPRALVDGLLARFDGTPPEALARATVYVNTRRMERRITELFAEGPPRLLPRLRLITDIGQESAAALPPPVPGLRRRLQLARLIEALIAAEPDLAPRDAAFDLATSLAALMDEMQGEGVIHEDIAALDVTDLSGHWARSQKFLALIGQTVAPDPSAPTDTEARQRRMVELLADRWADAPPTDPVIVAGSTGSRGATALFMRAVAGLPCGAVVLPGVDAHMPPDIWARLVADPPQEDHPQYRFAALARALGQNPATLREWAPVSAPSPARNALVSLALRPAPVTDGWRRDGPSLGDLTAATAGLSLIEAPDPRFEAMAIALRLRAALEDGQTAALITPDRMLTRRVAATLDRWGIEPDDSAGEPLRQTAAGRLVRHVADLFGQRLTGAALIVLLKHPMVHAGSGRNQHLKWARDLERRLRRQGPPFPDAAALADWARGARGSAPGAPDPVPWAEWVAATCLGHEWIGVAPLADLTETLMTTVEALAIGADGDHATLKVWADPDGRAAHKALSDLLAEADHGAPMAPPAFRAVLESIMGGEVREPVTPDPRVMIWGTLEARVQGADLVILGSLNDGSWPEMPSPDPWLNRRMRRDAGLLLPERRIGLSAHDFQQAIAAPEVVLSRARRDGEAETVASRWLNRLVNLMDGLPDQSGPAALAEMRARGARWTALAQAMDRPAATLPPAPRPSPVPPVAHRPRALPVTDVERLIRDPYEVYAKRILRLRPLDPLHRDPDARDRGRVLHLVMERFVPDFATLLPAEREERLMQLAQEVLETEVPWPAARRMWLARIARIAEPFLADEEARHALGHPMTGEQKGTLDIPAPKFTLTAKADRVDMTADGAYLLYDYKTGSPPTAPQQKQFAKQLLLEAVIAEQAGFGDAGPAPVLRAEYIGLGATPKVVAAPLADAPPADVLAEFLELVRRYDDPDTGYTAQSAPETDSFDGDYLHLARAGEWDLSDTPGREKVGH